MNDQRRHRAVARGFFELVDPPAVVRERAAGKKFGIVRGRLVDKQQSDLSLQVHALVVVPLIFRRGDSVTDENNGRVDVGDLGLRFVMGDEVVKIFQRQRFAFGWRQRERGGRQRRDGHHGHFLEVGAMVARGLQPVDGKLRSDVFRGEIAATLRHSTPFQQIAGKKFHIGANFLRVNLRLIRGTSLRGKINAADCQYSYRRCRKFPHDSP